MMPRLLISAALLMPLAAPAEDGFAQKHIRFFERSVRPILEEHCVKCHGEDRAEGSLHLDTRAGVIAGSASGMAIDQKNPTRSRLMLAVKHTGDERGVPDMPDEGPKLAKEEIAALQRWIELNLPWPADASRIPSG